jgi:hypothetical protein
MGFTDFFKRKQPKYDSTNIRVTDLDVGFVFEYDLESWEVQASYEYDWGDNYFSKEYKINNGSKTLFLSIEEDDEISLSVCDKINVRELGGNVLADLLSNQKPPTTLLYQDKKYFFEQESPGYFNDKARGEDWVEFISWDFIDESGKYIVTIEQWDEKEFEASAGKAIQEFEISTILPK